MNLKNFVAVALSLSLVIVVALTGGCIHRETIAIEDITPQDAFTLIQENQNDPDFIIIDVRTEQEFNGGHIEDAINIDYNSETFQSRLNDLNKDKIYLVYCRSGNRSRKAVDIMLELNFKEVYNILGGISQWETAGFTTVE
jgi:rhodanese-related sulfurtransferase